MDRQALLRLFLMTLLLLGIFWLLLHQQQIDWNALEQWIADAGLWAPLLFIFVYLLGLVLFLPGTLLTLLGGALFGPWWGGLFSLIGATLGAGCAFLIARYLNSGWIEKTAGEKLHHLLQGVRQAGWRFVAFVRLVPIFPFNFLNYALGLTSIPFSQYLITTLICIIPGTVGYSYFGHLAKLAAFDDLSLTYQGLAGAGLFLFVIALPKLLGLAGLHLFRRHEKRSPHNKP